MVLVPAYVLLAQTASVGDSVSAAKAVAEYELKPWRKLHPTADLALTFTDPTVPPAYARAIRAKLGYKDAPAVLSSTVLTIVFGPVVPMAAKQVSMEAYVFLGSFPKGYRARYVVDTGGKTPRVLSRTILDKYEMTRGKPNT